MILTISMQALSYQRKAAKFPVSLTGTSLLSMKNCFYFKIPDEAPVA